MRLLFALLFVLIGCSQNGGSPSMLAASPETQPQIPEARPAPSLPNARCQNFDLPNDHVRSEDYLAFANFGYRGVGRCRGHAILSQKLLFLMRFNPHESWNCGDEFTCKDELRNWLNDVEEGRAVTVPGFSNLAEFSAHPWVTPVLKGRIISYGTSYQAIRLPLPGGSSRSINVFREAVRRVKSNQVPYVALQGLQVGNHGVLAYRVAGHKLCVRDPNIVPSQGREECDNFMFIDGESIRYIRIARAEDIVTLEMTDDEDKRVAIYRRALCN